MDRVCYIRGRIVGVVPHDLCRTGIQMGPNANCIWIDGSMEEVYNAGTEDDYHWFFREAKKRSKETYGLVENTFFFASEDTILECFRQDQWVIVLDGSYSPIYKKGTAAVIIESLSGTQLLKSYVLTPGMQDDINAYRSELIGIYVGCLILEIYTKHIGVIDQQISFGCDNEKAVQLGLMSTTYSPVMTRHMDIPWEMNVQMKWESQHVRGHQSLDQCHKSQMARMDNEADELAKRYLRFSIDNS